jgi:hypothetical protein
MARVSIPGVGDYERLTVLAPWGGEEFVRYLPVKATSELTRKIRRQAKG